MLHLQVQVSAPVIPPLDSITPVELGLVQDELARLKHQLRTSKSLGAQAIVRQFDNPRAGPAEGLFARCREWNEAKSESSFSLGPSLPQPDEALGQQTVSTPGDYIQETAAI